MKPPPCCGWLTETMGRASTMCTDTLCEAGEKPVLSVPAYHVPILKARNTQILNSSQQVLNKEGEREPPYINLAR